MSLNFGPKSLPMIILPIIYQNTITSLKWSEYLPITSLTIFTIKGARVLWPLPQFAPEDIQDDAPIIYPSLNPQ